MSDMATLNPVADPDADPLADLGAFLLTEELPADPRGPDTPGYPLTWTEHPRRGAPYERHGTVLGPAPRPGAVWVQPAQQRPGEGAAIVVDRVVDRVTPAGAAPCRYVGTLPDVLSTAEWQRVDLLPRLWLRVDVVADTHPATRRTRRHEQPRIHARPRCRGKLHGATWLWDRGRPVKLAACFRVRGWVHPLSVRPVLDQAPVPVCGVCVEEPPTSLFQPLFG